MRSPFDLISPRDHGRAAAGLVGLMIASALSEGVGIVLLVPMLGAIGGGGLVGGKTARVLAAIGLPVALGPLLALFVALVLLRVVINHARAKAALRLESELVDGLRRRALSGLLHCDWRVLVTMHQADNAGLLITIFDRIGFAFDQAIAALAAACTLIGLAAAAWVLAPTVAVTGVAGGALVLVAYRQLRARAATLGEALDNRTRSIHRELAEKLAALRVIKSLGAESETEAGSAAQFADLRATQMHWQHSAGVGQGALEAGGAVVLAGLVWMALLRWHVAAGTLLPMVALFARALPLLGGFQLHWQNWVHARPALDAAAQLIARTEAAPEHEGAGQDSGPAPELRARIALEHVSVRFAPESPPALDAVCLHIGARETVMITGHSGAGKSTLADLLGGLLSPDAGQICIDEQPLAGAARRAWRRRVAYVQQEPVLLSASLRDNLLWADPAADDTRIAEALAASSANFVADLPQGLDTPIGEGGRRLSGGERQRIVLARALLRDPALLILDEATSALDAANAAAIAEALARLKGRLAIVIIGHSDRLAGLADRTIVLDRGRVVEEG